MIYQERISRPFGLWVAVLFSNAKRRHLSKRKEAQHMFSEKTVRSERACVALRTSHFNPTARRIDPSNSSICIQYFEHVFMQAVYMHPVDRLPRLLLQRLLVIFRRYCHGC